MDFLVIGYLVLLGLFLFVFLPFAWRVIRDHTKTGPRGCLLAIVCVFFPPLFLALLVIWLLSEDRRSETKEIAQSGITEFQQEYPKDSHSQEQVNHPSADSAEPRNSQLVVLPVNSGPIERILRTRAKFNGEDIYAFENIPSQKKLNARAACKLTAQDTILILVDATVFGNAKNCLLITESGIHVHNSWSAGNSGHYFVPWTTFKSTEKGIFNEGKHELSLGGGVCLDTSAIDDDSIKTLIEVFATLERQIT